MTNDEFKKASIAIEAKKRRTKKVVIQKGKLQKTIKIEVLRKLRRKA